MSTVILVDTSASMALPVRGELRRIDALEAALRGVLADFPAAILLAFSSEPRWLEVAKLTPPGETDMAIALPPPAGSTALHLAIPRAMTLAPDVLIVISDGEPDDAAAALREIRVRAPITVHTIYCGDPDDRGAIAFMRDLSLAGGTGRGRWLVRGLEAPARLAYELRLLLTGPSR